MNLEKIRKIAFEQMGEKSSHPGKEKGNKYFHGQRVAKIALTLRKVVLPDGDGHDETLTVAAWFHDILNGASSEHCSEGAEYTKNLLCDLIEPKKLDEIYEIIRVHDERDCDKTAFSDVMKIHQDADLLDHMGTMFVWEQFLYSGSHVLTPQDTAEWCNSRVNGDFGRYVGELNFDISREILADKRAFYEEFLHRFSAESVGEIYNFDEIVGQK